MYIVCVYVHTYVYKLCMYAGFHLENVKGGET